MAQVLLSTANNFSAAPWFGLNMSLGARTTVAVDGVHAPLNETLFHFLSSSSHDGEMTGSWEQVQAADGGWVSRQHSSLKMQTFQPEHSLTNSTTSLLSLVTSEGTHLPAVRHTHSRPTRLPIET